jgi:hypothetical protein
MENCIASNAPERKNKSVRTGRNAKVEKQPVPSLPALQRKFAPMPMQK